ncbi:MAG: HEAT repeat domain-containing protein [Planctomycetaceae bacterium]|nr:HEAT repeat domain-containing protein [Planctomycetaceae bacterium]
MKPIRMVVLVALLLQAVAVLGAEPRGIRRLTKALKRERTREVALWEMRDFGLDAAPAVPQLIRLLDASDESTRDDAAELLGAIGKDAAPAVPKLIEKLAEPEPHRFAVEVPVTDVGLSAAVALGAIGEDALEPLVDSLRDQRPRVRELAAFALGKMGPDAREAVASLVDRLDDVEAPVRREATCSLGKIGSDAGDSVAALVQTLTDEDDFVRATAAEALGFIRPTSPVAVEGLIAALHDKEGDVQHEAARTMGELGEQAAPATAALAEMLSSRGGYRYSHPVQYRPLAGTAARALGAIGPQAEQAMPALLQLIKDASGSFDRFGPDDHVDNYQARGEAAVAAARIDPQSDDLLDVLGQSLEVDDRIRGQVAVALALLGPKAKDLVPSLLRFTETLPAFSSQLSCACTAVVLEPDNSAAVQTMIDLISPDSSPYHEEEWDLLRTAIAKAGERARPAIPALVVLLRDSSEDQSNAARTLAVFGSQAEAATPAFLDLLDNQWDHPRKKAIAAFQQITSEKSPLLLAALEDPNAQVRSGVVEVLGKFPGAVPVLIEALGDPSLRVQLAALNALTGLKESARPAIPKITDLLKADSRTIREAAGLALKEIQ